MSFSRVYQIKVDQMSGELYLNKVTLRGLHKDVNQCVRG